MHSLTEHLSNLPTVHCPARLQGLTKPPHVRDADADAATATATATVTATTATATATATTATATTATATHAGDVLLVHQPVAVVVFAVEAVGLVAGGGRAVGHHAVGDVGGGLREVL